MVLCHKAKYNEHNKNDLSTSSSKVFILIKQSGLKVVSIKALDGDKPHSWPSASQLLLSHAEIFPSGWQVSHHPFSCKVQLHHMLLKISNKGICYTFQLKYIRCVTSLALKMSTTTYWGQNHSYLFNTHSLTFFNKWHKLKY